ncbi:MAG TPA: hypothetical protein VLF87_00515 [Patescibacteria group bacterium]|nr:hypothetical protein [Candidatus Saccharimonadales bacterium]HSX46462.1 hypothetical protein [Patescibacteria group bacterium]
MKRFKKPVILTLLTAVLSLLIIGAISLPAHADTFDNQCQNDANGNSGLIGFGRFTTGVTIPAGGTGSVNYRTYVCNGSDHTIDKDITMTDNFSCVVDINNNCVANNALDFSQTTWGLDGQNFWEQDMGGFAPHTWRSKDATIVVNGAAFQGTGSYRVKVHGKGRIWDATNGCTYPNGCYGDTNTVDIYLQLFVQRPDVVCSTLGLQPQDPAPGANVAVTMNLKVNTGQIDNSAFPLDITINPPVGPNQSYTNVAYQPSPATGSVGISYSIPTIVNAPSGNYTVTGTLRGPSWFTPVVCQNTFLVATRPYFRVYDGDTSVGWDTCGVGADWNLASGSNLYAYNTGDGTGSGTQLAAFVLGEINGHSTGTGRTSNPKPPGIGGLSFSNTNGNAFFGGAFQTLPCPTDYFKQKGSTSPTSSPFNPATIGAGKYLYNAGGSLDIDAGLGSISDGITGKHIELYVDGDVRINSNITYTPWASLAGISSFKLVARGNIYIDPTVTQLDGTYIAQPDTSHNRGRIYTCSKTGQNAPPIDTQLANQSSVNGQSSCQRQLVVNGSFVAQSIGLYRSNGDFQNNSSNGELRSSTNIGEVFIFGPENWLSTGTSSTTVNDYDSITSLPPVL